MYQVQILSLLARIVFFPQRLNLVATLCLDSHSKASNFCQKSTIICSTKRHICFSDRLMINSLTLVTTSILTPRHSSCWLMHGSEDEDAQGLNYFLLVIQRLGFCMLTEQLTQIFPVCVFVLKQQQKTEAVRCWSCGLWIAQNLLEVYWQLKTSLGKRKIFCVKKKKGRKTFALV